MATPKPRIAITVGDPAGIGPEVAQKAAGDPRVHEACEPVLYGPPPDARFEPGVLSPAAGLAAYEAICSAVRDAQTGTVSGAATAPVNKTAFARALCGTCISVWWTRTTTPKLDAKQEALVWLTITPMNPRIFGWRFKSSSAS